MKREALAHLVAEHHLSVRRACAAVRLSRAAYCCGIQSVRGRDDTVIEGLNRVEAAHPRWGFWKCFNRLRLDWRGLPQAIRCDNGPEMLSQAFVDWCNANQVEIRYIQPGKPNQNAFIERFNRTYRDEVLDAHLFETLSQVRELTYRWLQTYNEIRPHDALGQIPPAVFRRQLEEAGHSTSELST